MISDPTEEELTLFISNNSEYYLKKWVKRFSGKDDLLLSWNWSAFLFSLFWLGYRKMYYYLLLIGGFMGINIVVWGTWWWLVLLFTHLALGLLGNEYYYLHARAKINLIKNDNVNSDHFKSKVIENGNTSKAGVAFSFIVIVVFVVLPKIFFPD